MPAVRLERVEQLKLVKSWLDWFNLPFYWVLTTALGGVVMYHAVLGIGAAAQGVVFRDLLTALTFVGAPFGGALGGLLVGGAQWLVLRRHQPRAGPWVLATVIGWSAGLTLAFGLFFWLLQDGLGYFTLLVPVLLGGALLGYTQALILRRWLPLRDGWWVLANAAGLAAGWVIALALVGDLLASPFIPPGSQLAALGALHGALVGLESGLALVALSALAEPA